MGAKGLNRQMFREMKAICGCNRLRKTETKIILNEDSQRDAQRAKHSNHAFAFGNIDSDCVHTSSCIQIATAIRVFHCRFDLFADANAQARRRLCLHKANAVNYSLGNEMSLSVTGCYRHEANI